MSALIRILISILLVAHGVGHTLGFFPRFGWAKVAGWSDQSWLLTPLLGEEATRWVGVIIWVTATCAFIIVGLGLLATATPLPWWRSLAISAAFVSLAGIVLFPSAFPSLSSTVGAVVVDLTVLVALLWLRWPTIQPAG